MGTIAEGDRAFGLEIPVSKECSVGAGAVGHMYRSLDVIASSIDRQSQNSVSRYGDRPYAVLCRDSGFKLGCCWWCAWATIQSACIYRHRLTIKSRLSATNGDAPQCICRRNDIGPVVDWVDSDDGLCVALADYDIFLGRGDYLVILNIDYFRRIWGPPTLSNNLVAISEGSV